MNLTIIAAASGIGLIVLILIFVYYCKVVKKNNETEVKQEKPVYYAENSRDDLPYIYNYYDQIK